MTSKQVVIDIPVCDEDYAEEEDNDDIPQTVSPAKEKSSVFPMVKRTTHDKKIRTLQDELEKAKTKNDHLRAEKNMYKKRLIQLASDIEFDSPVVIAESLHAGDVNTVINNYSVEQIIGKVEHKVNHIKRSLRDSNHEMVKMNLQLQQAKQTLHAVQAELGSMTRTDSETLTRVRFIQGLLEIQTSPQRSTSLFTSAIESIKNWRNQTTTLSINELRFDILPDDSKVFIKYIVVRFEMYMEPLLNLLKTPSAVRDQHSCMEDVFCRAMIHWIDDHHDAAEFKEIVEELENSIVEKEKAKSEVVVNITEEGDICDTGNEHLQTSICSSSSSVVDELARRETFMQTELKKIHELLEIQQSDIKTIKEKIAPEPKKRVTVA